MGIPSAYRFSDNSEVKEGDIIIDFRGDRWMFVAVMLEGNSYKVYARREKDARSHRFFFPSVFKLDIR